MNGRDPLAYIVSANLERRNLTKGQQAMALAMIYPEPGERGRGKKSDALKSAASAGFSGRRLNEARSVLHHSRELAKSVIKGTISLDEALRDVEKEKAKANTADGKLARLQAEAPDLCTRVAEENLTLDEAIAILDKRTSPFAAMSAASSCNSYSSSFAPMRFRGARGPYLRSPSRPDA